MKILVFVEDGAQQYTLGFQLLKMVNSIGNNSMIFYILMINPLHSQNLQKHFVCTRTIGLKNENLIGIIIRHWYCVNNTS